MSKKNISSMIQKNAKAHGSKIALRQTTGDLTEQYSYHEIDRDSGYLASGLIRLGIVRGDRIALLSESRPRWAVPFFAAMKIGAIAVPLDINLSEDELSVTLERAQPILLIVSADLMEKASRIKIAQPEIRILSLEPASVKTSFPSIDSIVQKCALPCIDNDASLPAVLTFTSGTMGSSKGVLTSHGNLLHQVRSLHEMMQHDSRCTVLSILPLSHLFELTSGFLSILYCGGLIYFCNSLLPNEIADAMYTRRITHMVTVPLFLKLYSSAIRKQVALGSRLQVTFFDTLTRFSVFLPIRFRKRLFQKIHSRLGGKFEYFVCGGAPLDRETSRFLEAIGIPVYQGYGLAEASPVITTNCPTGNRHSSVGKALPDVEIQIQNDGEILTRGPHIMDSYLGESALTREMIDDEGWLHTGDLGHVDSHGYLHISGRKKNVIVLGSGKKVHPEEIEEVLFKHPDIEEVCVVGILSTHGLLKDTEQVCVVVVPTSRAIIRANRLGENLQRKIENVIREKARRLPYGYKPARVVIRKKHLPRTSTQKIRRPTIHAWLNRAV